MRVRTALVGAVSLLACASAALFALSEAGTVDLPGPPLELVAGLACAVQAVLLWRSWSTDAAERGVRTAFTGALAVLGVSMVVQALVDVFVGTGALDTRMRTSAFGVGSLVFGSLIFLGLVRWNQFRDGNEFGHWLNGASASLALIAVGQVLLPVLHLPMARWGAFQQMLWLGNLSSLLVQLGTAATVARLGGMTRDRRLQVVIGSLVAALGVGVAVGLTGDLAANAAAGKALWVGMASSLSVVALLPAAPVHPPAKTSQSPLYGAMVVIGGTLAALALGAMLGKANQATVVVALTAALVAGGRLMLLISALTELAESRVEARTDDLTGVANRRALMMALAATRARGHGGALLIVDLDRFKEVNDQHGHRVGDEVLRAVAFRLELLVPAGGLLGRLGGDEFAMVVPGGLSEARRMASVVHQACVQPLATSAGRMRVGASVGVAAMTPAHSEGEPGRPVPGSGDLAPGELLRRADAALYHAKRSGGGVSIFDREADVRVRAERRRATELKELLAWEHDGRHGSVVVHFQPQLDIRSGAAVGAEALVRWQHPEHGLLGPGAFLDLVERHGLMMELTSRVLEQAVTGAAAWRRAGHEVRVAVNVSTSCLVHPDLLPMVDGALSRSGLSAAHLDLEVTETTLMSDPDRAQAIIAELAARGIGLSIDDYGTGYSSLAYLNDLRASELKLDRSFIGRLLQDQRTAAIVVGTIDLAHGLGVRVVAEGVEDERTLDVLRRFNCDRSQGFLHGRPMPEDAFVSWLEAHSRSLAPTITPVRVAAG